MTDLEKISCQECQSSCVVKHGTITICSNCGWVCEESLLQTDNPEGSFSPSSFQPFHRQERATRVLFNGCKEIVRKLALDGDLLTPLDSLVTRVAQLSWPCYQHWFPASCAACVYIVARMHSKPVNMTDCSIAANCIVSETGRVYQQLIAQLALQVPPGDPFALLWRVCSILLTLLFPDSEQRHSSSLGSVYHLSCKLLWYAEQRWLLTGRKPIHVVIAASTLAATCCGLLSQERRRQLWRDMSKHLSSTEQSIRQRYNEFTDTLLKDAKALLPWADQLDQKNIHQNVSLLLTILGYCSNKEETSDDHSQTMEMFLPPCVQNKSK
ncbi:hypothetical protein GpartN1_g1305.t1 [Galdieria partita]|uniref:BRF2-like C-terminal domain-containing protein n=1 Tax=Galdieria partita TaxID=83374 RepID=A0A9C7PSM0_9RHOD|nr:hypothetical protein GpartN1_g1305.t1 [Galdieria partita]